jgi:lipopolysaccharide transport system permease protein
MYMQSSVTDRMDSNRPVSTSPLAAVESLVANRQLTWALVKRDFVGRYKGSIMGVAWSMFNPLLMLVIYTFVFSVAFKARWGTGVESKTLFAIVLFCGIIVHGLLAECLNRAPTLIVAHANYVKKVVFPLEILPFAVLLSAILHFLVSFAVLLLACMLLGEGLRSDSLWMPVILFPMLLMGLGLSWILASLGVYLRDLTQGIGIATTVLLFVSPVFYPVASLPEGYRWIVELNPITLPVNQLRDVVLWGAPIDWVAWAMSLAVGVVFFCVGFWWFQKSRKGFSDVL